MINTKDIEAQAAFWDAKARPAQLMKEVNIRKCSLRLGVLDRFFRDLALGV